VATICFGVLIVLASLWFETLKHLTLFDIMLQLGGWVGIPITVPLIWGMFVRRAPQWAGWSTVLVALTTSYLTQRFLTARWLGGVVGFELNPREANDWAAAAGIVLNIVVGSAWFLLTPLLARRPRPPVEADRVDRFFAEMRTPVDFEREQGPGSDNLQAKLMGILCLIYGGFITSLAAIPNPPTGRLAFVFCGLVMFGVGWMLHRSSKAKDARVEAVVRGVDAPAPPDASVVAKSDG
jgi:hypothetical protein